MEHCENMGGLLLLIFTIIPVGWRMRRRVNEFKQNLKPHVGRKAYICRV